jgi:hypothetical protein
MATPRPVRIPRGPASPRPTDVAGSLVERRPNVAGSQRAFRTAFGFLAALVALDLVLVALDLSSSEATRPGVQSGLQLFVGVAILIAVAAVVVALSPAPRYVELRSDGVAVVGRWGQRGWLPPATSLDLQVIRHFPAGWMSSIPVDVVQVTDRAGRRRTYHVQSGLFSADGPKP